MATRIDTLNSALESMGGTRRNVAGHFYTITKIRRTPAKQRRSTGNPWQFWAVFDPSPTAPLPDWYPASDHDIDGILYETRCVCGQWLHGANGCSDVA